MLKHKSEKIELLEKLPLFDGLTRKQVEQVGRLADLITVPAGRRLATAGERGGELIVIVEGHVSVTVGRRRPVRLGPGEFFGEMSLVDGKPRSATVEAASDLLVLVVGQRAFSSLVEASPLIALRIMQVLARRLRATEALVSA